jgi:hypothetical protein
LIGRAPAALRKNRSWGRLASHCSQVDIGVDFQEARCKQY